MVPKPSARRPFLGPADSLLIRRLGPLNRGENLGFEHSIEPVVLRARSVLVLVPNDLL